MKIRWRRTLANLRCTLLHWPWWNHGEWEDHALGQIRYSYCQVCDSCWKRYRGI